jgi:hypothetical protein
MSSGIRSEGGRRRRNCKSIGHAEYDSKTDRVGYSNDMEFHTPRDTKQLE